MFIKLLKVFGFSVVLVLGSVKGLRADAPTTDVVEALGKGKGECRVEIAKLCPGLEKGAALGKCVDEHMDQLSPKCKERFQKRKEKHEQVVKLREAMKEACKADQEKFCPGKELGEGLLKCAKEKESELSAGCKEAIEKLKEERPHRKQKGSKGKAEVKE